jgi:rhodanese-related sulfurtransferase
MATATQTTGATLRMDAAEAKRRIEGGESAIILDVRSQQAWDGSDVKIAGAQRVTAEHFEPGPSWPKNQMILAYCT